MEWKECKKERRMRSRERFRKEQVQNEISEIFGRSLEGLQDLFGSSAARLGSLDDSQIQLLRKKERAWQNTANVVRTKLRENHNINVESLLRTHRSELQTSLDVETTDRGGASYKTTLYENDGDEDEREDGDGLGNLVTLHERGSVASLVDVRKTIEEGLQVNEMNDSKQNTQPLTARRGSTKLFKRGSTASMLKRNSITNIAHAVPQTFVNEDPEERENRIIARRVAAIQEFIHKGSIDLDKLYSTSRVLSQHCNSKQMVHVRWFISCMSNIFSTQYDESSEENESRDGFDFSSDEELEQAASKEEGEDEHDDEEEEDGLDDPLHVDLLRKEANKIFRSKQRAKEHDGARKRDWLQNDLAESEGDMTQHYRRMSTQDVIKDEALILELIEEILAAFEEPLKEGFQDAVIRPRRRKSVDYFATPATPMQIEPMLSSMSTVDQADAREVDYRQLLFQLCKGVKCAVMQRLEFFYHLYGKNGVVSIHGICALLYWGDRLVASSLEEGEAFMKRIDEDGDGTITWDEFQAAVEQEPFLLDSIARKHTMNLASTKHARTLRTLVHRMNLSWDDIHQLWLYLQKIGKKEAVTVGSSELFQVHVDRGLFEDHILTLLRPPQPDDGVLVRLLLKIFGIGSSCIEAQNFVSCLAAALGELNIGVSQSTDKARFFFSLYNIDGDRVLSRDEIFTMLYGGSTEESSQRILHAMAVLRSIDKDGDEYISIDEYTQAVIKDPQLLSYFKPHHSES